MSILLVLFMRNLKDNISEPSMIGVRHFLFLQLFLAVVIVYGMRANLSVGIVAMTSEDKTGGYPVSISHERSFPFVTSFWLCLDSKPMEMSAYNQDLEPH